MAHTVGMRNNREVVQGMGPVFDKALDYVMEQIKLENEKAIKKTIYNRNKTKVVNGQRVAKNVSYKRTEEFKTVPWDSTTDPNETGVDLRSGHKSAALFGFLHPEDMTEDEETATHSSPEWAKIGDIRPYLAEIIYEGKSGPLFGQGHWTKPRNAFEELLKRIGGRDKIIAWFKTGLRKQGITRFR